MEKFQQNIIEAEKIIQKASHLLYMTYPLIQDKKILLKVLTQTKDSLAKIISAILQYEYLFKRIKLYKDPFLNLKTFKEKSYKRFSINEEELQTMIKILDLAKKHQQSPMEFTRDNKIIILSEYSKPSTVTLENIKVFISLNQNIIRKVQITISKNQLNIKR